MSHDDVILAGRRENIVPGAIRCGSNSKRFISERPTGYIPKMSSDDVVMTKCSRGIVPAAEIPQVPVADSSSARQSEQVLSAARISPPEAGKNFLSEKETQQKNNKGREVNGRKKEEEKRKEEERGARGRGDSKKQIIEKLEKERKSTSRTGRE